MLFENNGTIQKRHMTQNPTEIDKYDTHKNGALQKWYTLLTNAQKVTLFAKE